MYILWLQRESEMVGRGRRSDYLNSEWGKGLYGDRNGKGPCSRNVTSIFKI